MTADEILERKFSKCCFTLSREDILDFNKDDNGLINNVIALIQRDCYGVKLYDDDYGLSADMFYVNNDDTLKGDIIRLDINDTDYYLLLLKFCTLLANDYKDIDALDAFNTFQLQLRSFLEKLGFFTTTNLELRQFEGKGAVMMSNAPRGIQKIRLIDKAAFYRNCFNDNYMSELVEGSEYVYLMLNTDTSLIKIGTSKNPRYRERTLHSQEPAIHLIAMWRCNKIVEKELHKQYSDKHKRGEWFRLSIKDIYAIDEFMTSKIIQQ